MGLAFEQQPKESAKAFAAFKVYLELGPERSLAAVSKKFTKSSRLIKRWSARFDWPGRVAAHAAHLAAIERQAIEGLARDKAIDWHKVHEAQKLAEWHLRTEYYNLALEGIRRWKKNRKRVGSLEGLARLGEVFVKLGRLASGMPTEIKEVSGEFKATLSVEWESALKKVYGGAKPAAVVEAEVVTEPAALPAPATGEVTP